MGVLWPEPHQIDAEYEPLIIAKGPNQVENLMLVEGNTHKVWHEGRASVYIPRRRTWVICCRPKPNPELVLCSATISHLSEKIS